MDLLTAFPTIENYAAASTRL